MLSLLSEEAELGFEPKVPLLFPMLTPRIEDERKLLLSVALHDLSLSTFQARFLLNTHLQEFSRNTQTEVGKRVPLQHAKTETSLIQVTQLS